MSSTIIQTDKGMAITNELVFASASDLLKQGNEYLGLYCSQSQSADFEIDCKSMLRIDSAGIAVLIEWQRQCVDAKKSCGFVGLSDQAQSLIQAYRLQTLIAT